MIYAVFVGATAPISDEISKIGKGRSNLRMIVPAVRKCDFGLNEKSIEVAFGAAIGVLRDAKIEQEKCRLVVITFRSSDFNAVTKLTSAFGASAWIEFIGNDNVHKASKLRAEIEEALGRLPSVLHEI